MADLLDKTTDWGSSPGAKMRRQELLMAGHHRRPARAGLPMMREVRKNSALVARAGPPMAHEAHLSFTPVASFSGRSISLLRELMLISWSFWGCHHHRAQDSLGPTAHELR